MVNKKFIIVCGHYGCGKTNFSLNLAIDRAKEGENVTLVDLDFVNPYFCSAGYKEVVSKYGVKMISTAYANTNVDLPAVVPEMYSVFENEGTVIVDLGGDDAGSAVLGRFFDRLKDIDYEMICVINKNRNLIAKTEDAVEILKEIESVSRCKVTSIVNNSHLKNETSADTIIKSISYAKDISDALNLPLLYTTVPRNLYEEVENKIDNKEDVNLYPVDIIVKTVWD